MPWVDMIMIVMVLQMKSSNWIAQETRSQAANGKKLEICNFQDLSMCLLRCQNRLMFAVEQTKSIKDFVTIQVLFSIVVLTSMST